MPLQIHFLKVKLNEDEMFLTYLLSGIIAALSINHVQQCYKDGTMGSKKEQNQETEEMVVSGTLIY